MERYVAYYRVSTVNQGRSGLGLESQRRHVHQLLKAGDRIIHEFTEVESACRSERPQLKNALSACRALNAKLVIAKLDRLSRSVSFISSLMDCGVEFVAADFPAANRLTIHLLAAVAEYEANLISTRTKQALKVARDRGVKLGGQRGHIVGPSARILAIGAVVAKADKRLNEILPLIQSAIQSGAKSNAGIARCLNQMEVPTPRSGKKGWTAVQVSRALERAKRLGIVH